MHSTLLMPTGFTFGLRAGYLDQAQYSVLPGVLIASAVIPTFMARKWFHPLEEKDLV
jgi:hypothetical protein